MNSDHPVVYLKGQADRRIRAGHVWIFSNEVDSKRSPLKAFSPGDQVQVCSAAGRPLGMGFINPNALICIRLFTRSQQGLSRKLLSRRLGDALALRQMHYSTPYYRLAYGDSDGLPGLVIDRFGEVFSVQISTAGMEACRQMIIETLAELFSPTAVLLKNDAKMRQAEGLPAYTEVVQGVLPERVEVVENGVRFHIDLRQSQKTGWFYDHRDNRARLKPYVAGKRVLDLFSYAGGWGIQAAVFGAREVVAIDASGTALNALKESAGLNNVSEKCQTIEGDVFTEAKKLVDAGEKFDVVICDPPALIPRRKDIRKGEQAYARLNQLAVRLLTDHGILVSASCSMHLGADKHMDLVRSAGRHVDRYLQVMGQFGQSPDHPILPAVPETAYLKAIFARSLQGW